MNIKIANRLLEFRKKSGLSQEELAEKLNITRQSVSKWESGQAYPEMDKMIMICQIFNISIDELVNQNFKEVNSIKQSKNNINKFIEDFCKKMEE